MVFHKGGAGVEGFVGRAIVDKEDLPAREGWRVGGSCAGAGSTIGGAERLGGGVVGLEVVDSFFQHAQ